MGFPNGRRLEDDVTTIELQAVSGVALGCYWSYGMMIMYPGVSASPVTNQFGTGTFFYSRPYP